MIARRLLVVLLLVTGSAQAAKKTVPVAAPVPAAPVLPPCVASRVEPPLTGAPPAFRDCDGLPVMVALPAGHFRMGDVLGTGTAYEKPVHEVTLRRFAIGRYEVTRGEWMACVAAMACAAPGGDAAGGDPQLPVAELGWNEIQPYLAWISQRSGQRYRLPSEAEWEYAARAGLESQYSWGNLVEPACEQANAFDRAGHRGHPQWGWQIECNDGYASSAPVGRFPPNAWGLHDMLGNVWEWVADCWHADYEGAPVDGSAWLGAGDAPACRKHVNRGGGWGNHPRTLRLSNRDADETAARSDGLGFRVARDLGQ
ncbi:formylglycine-generating enzyme family protein [Hydrocarboniphaga sp.]|uniref:formylglycine-generating enzyme family protein n=1 Tax=Hydrocarboniphaga sp. TaxID=2033016 RepID=UPI003D13FA77